MDVLEVCDMLNTLSVKNDKDTGLPADIETFINEIIEVEGYKTYQCETKPISTNGGNYLGDLYEVYIKGKTANGDNATNLFIKKILPIDGNMKVLSIKDVYKREIFAYCELSKILTDIQAEVNVPVNERYKMVKSYGSGTSKVLILENMIMKGYKSFDRMDVVSLQYAEMAVKELAKFHSLSFAIQKLRPNFYETKIKSLECLYIFGKEFDDFIENIYSKTIDRLNSDHSRAKFKNFSKNAIEKYTSIFKESNSKTYVLSHGDYRPNNILMKVKDGDVSELLPVDYQLLHYGNPMNDFFYFISLSSDQKLRQNHLYDLKNLYYDTLKDFLLYFKIDSEEVYSRELFEFDFKDRFEYGLMVGIQYLPFVIANDEAVIDVTKDDFTSLDVPKNIEYVERINGLVDDYIQWGYL